VASLLERPDAIVPQFQPIVALTTGRVAGYEALSRFHGVASRPPDVWFAQARACGLGPELEARALMAALSCPDRPTGTFLTLNVSPSALGSRKVASALPDDLSDVILELTEHEVIATSRVLDHALAELRERGARIALDDVGSAYSGLQSVVSVRPDIIKIDRDLTSGVHHDPAKSALIESFVSFAHSTNAAVCAEGIEHLDEALFLADLDVLYGQGYRLARPADPWTAVDPGVAQALLRRSLTGAAEAGAGLFPDTRGRRLELVIGRLSEVSSVAELNQLMPLVAQELNADEAKVSDWNVDAGYVESLTGALTGADDRYWLADYPSTADALHAQEAVQVLADEAEADTAEAALLRSQGYRSLLMVPIIHRRVSTGLLEALSTANTPWSRTAINRARIIAYHLGTVLATLDHSPRPHPWAEPTSASSLP
jgi:EAL domain-containing protein (putative c-di-GMP-specific phosphodiesterase class I)